MTAPDDKTLDRCTAALAEVREAWVIDVSFDKGEKFYRPWNKRNYAWGPAGTRAECQAWIDREAARACRRITVEECAVLAACQFDERSRTKSANVHWQDGYEEASRDVAAAVTAILKGEA